MCVFVNLSHTCSSMSWSFLVLCKVLIWSDSIWVNVSLCNPFIFSSDTISLHVCSNGNCAPKGSTEPASVSFSETKETFTSGMTNTDFCSNVKWVWKGSKVLTAGSFSSAGNSILTIEKLLFDEAGIGITS